MYPIIWLAALAVLLVLEAVTVALVCIWFAAGAFAALIASLCGAALWLQIVLFFAVSAASLLALRPITRKYLRPRIVPTNMDAVIGQTGRVIETVDNAQTRGQVKLDTMQWSARSTDGTVIEAGTFVIVDKIEGAKLFVSPKN